MPSWNREVDVAVAAARQAAELALKYQQGIEVETKPDDSPVTRADRECERLIASILTSSFPDDGIFAEEGSRVESKNARRWIIDPIDGTRDYVRGNPLWANLIALEDGAEVVAGIVNLPALGLTYTASKGGGAFRNGSPIHPSSKTRPGESVLCFSGFTKLDKLPFRGTLLDWMSRFWAVRALGGAPDAMMVAAGQAEIFIEADAKPWDFAPLKIIVEEAGGVYLNLDGGKSIYAGNCIICAPGLEAEVRDLLGLNT
jgi:histidinol phosphatase-like enzyme (inositol monophosphatase family)